MQIWAFGAQHNISIPMNPPPQLKKNIFIEDNFKTCELWECFFRQIIK